MAMRNERKRHPAGSIEPEVAGMKFDASMVV
jgi:hypothetical protein